MSDSMMNKKFPGNSDHADAHPLHQGFIAFCETNLRYEKGFKAWLLLGPYLLGALGLEILIDSGYANTTKAIGPWVAFLAYLVLFPPAWQRILKLVAAKKSALFEPGASSAVKLQ